MDLNELRGRLPYEINESLTARGITEFTEPQSLAIESGLIEGKSIVVASPTASGKTLIAEVACVNTILAKRRKAIYIAPMKAIVNEKYDEFRAAYPYIKTAISIGDLDSEDQWLSKYEMIFVSTEKFDSLIRHGMDWIGSIGCIVFDEVHMLGDPSRGPTLELLMTKLKSITDAQLIALSATIGNADEISKWIGAELVESNFRPVKLRKGIVYDGSAYYQKDKEEKHTRKKEEKWQIEELDSRSKLPEVSIVEDTLLKGKQALIFYSSRRNAEAGAIRLSDTVKSMLNANESKSLEKLAYTVLHTLDNPTMQCMKLSKLIEKGTAFHHAGLLNSQRSLIENACRNNLIKVVCSTTTLGLGVNLPAHTVLVKDTHRYDGTGSTSIGVNELMQLFGRAGRPKYDKEGRALIIGNSKENMELLGKRYLDADLEPIDSSLGIAPVMRMHILAFIAEEFLNTKNAIDGFLAKSFYGFQYKNMSDIKYNVLSILRELAKWDFVSEEGNAFYATKLGKRISQLYIDPLSARWIIESLKEKRDLTGNLFMLCNTLEMRPYAKATEEALAGYVAHLNTSNKKIFDSFDTVGEYGTYEPDKAYSTALLLHDWMQEIRENTIVEKYATTPGFLYNKLAKAEWLVYSAIELAKILHVSTHDLVNINARLRYGIKEELLDLVRLQGIGRVRARLLYGNGIETVRDINSNREKVIKLLGKEIAGKVFDQL